ncbi:unnamed protein product [Linum trigynum]|uniref:Uncharacterized protein n=1 Tax=Linum trigynum TaxID=586398 RepID=A0AAV2E417_9ROSI
MNPRQRLAQPSPDSSTRRLSDRELMQAFLGIFQNAIEILSSLSEHSPSLRGELTQFFRQAVADEFQLLMADEQERRTAQTDHVIIDIIDSEEAETEPPSPVINGSGTEPRNQNERAAQVEDRIIHREIEMTIPSFNPLPFMPTLRAGSSLTNFTGSESSATRSRGAAKETDDEGTGKRKKA